MESKTKLMSFPTRELRESNADAEMANEWLGGWKFNPLPIELYPSTGLVMSSEDGNPIYVGFVWTSNSGMAQIGFVTRNPFYKTKLPKDTRKQFLHDLKEYAHSLGYPYVITWTENKNLIGDFVELGFRETSNRVSELINYKI